MKCDWILRSRALVSAISYWFAEQISYRIGNAKKMVLSRRQEILF